jgi:ABC-type sulfate transport system permease component
MYNLILNKKGEIPETFTWVFATPIIVGVLVLFLIISVMLFGVKSISIREVQSDVSDESPIFSMKTSLAHGSIGNLNKEAIDAVIGEWNDAK